MALKVSKKKLSLFTSNFSLTYFIFFIILTFVLMFMDYRYDYLKQIRKDLSIVTSPFISSSNSIMNFFENIQDSTKSNASLRDEIKQLNIKIDKLSIENQIRNFLVAENENLREANFYQKNFHLKKLFLLRLQRRR